jgi:Ca2+-binding RTX toxin-like protein
MTPSGGCHIRGMSSQYGGEGNDILLGSRGNHALYGGEGLNRLEGLQGNDSLYGGSLNDTIYGGLGADTVLARKGNDQVHLGGGDDVAWLAGGNDAAYGGLGNDTLYAGTGLDNLSGGAGADRFVFLRIAETGLGRTQDRIADFSSAGGDKIDLSAIAPGLHFITTGFAGSAGDVRFDATTTTLQIDLDGDGGADGSIKLFTAIFGAGDLILA